MTAPLPPSRLQSARLGARHALAECDAAPPPGESAIEQITRLSLRLGAISYALRELLDALDTQDAPEPFGSETNPGGA